MESTHEPTRGDPPGPDMPSEVIRADIEATQNRMSETLDQLGERLSPERVASDAVHAVVHEVSESTIEPVRRAARRLPASSLITAAAIVSVGIALLVAWRLRKR